MQETIELLKENNLLRVIEEEVDIDLQIPHIAYVEVKKEDSKALLFTRPVSKRLDKKFDVPVLMNVFGSFAAAELFFGRDPDDIAAEIEGLLHMQPPSGFMDKMGIVSQLFNLKNIFPKRLKKKGICQEIIFEDIDLYKKIPYS